MEREIRKEREERERRREDDGLFDRREKETSKYNYLVVKEREREREREKRRTTSIGIFALLLCTGYHYYVLGKKEGLSRTRSGMAPGTDPYHAGTVQAHYVPGTAGSW